jgi:hypothetical protein
MAAGLGFKDFVTGEVLTAADVDSYLMQGIWVFASAAARDAAVTSPQEGNFAYLKDTNVTTYYTGSAWANLDTTGMTNPMTTTGDVIYSSPGSTPVRLGIGTAGQVLKVNSGATAPEWGTAAGASYTWTDFTPTFTNFTLGNGSIDQARYLQIDKIVFVMVNVILGSTSSVTGVIQITCPVTSSVPDYTHLFDCSYADDSAGIAVRGQAYILTNKINLRANTADQSYVRIANLSSTVPFTWASSDSFNLYGFYRAS